MVHQIDECCWIKDAWPVSAHGVGGRIANSPDCSENLDSYSIEYTFADGTKAMVVGRYIPKCYNEFATFRPRHEVRRPVLRQYPRPHGPHLQGSAGGGRQHRLEAPREAVNPWQDEWNVLLDAIRNDRPHNEAQRAAYADLASIMGRAAVHSGKIITWDEALASNFQFCPDRRLNSPPRARRRSAPTPNGRYPAPVPGTAREV